MKKNIFDGVEKEDFETGNKINNNKFDDEEYIFDDLIECYKEWREFEKNKVVSDSYQIATEFLKKYKIPSLSKDRINEFADDEEINRPIWSGVFISAMINELYENEEIHLSSDNLNYLGCYNKNKKIIVEGDCGKWTGSNMKGGEIIVKGDCGYLIGSNMKGGIIRICGDNFDPKEQISEFAKIGKIYHKYKLVWENGVLI